MLSNQARIFLACLSGGGIGSLVAFQASPLFWWVGLLVGAMTGYLVFDFRRVMEAIPAAFRAARGIDFTPFLEEMKSKISAFPFFFLSLWSWVYPMFILLDFPSGTITKAWIYFIIITPWSFLVTTLLLITLDRAQAEIFKSHFSYFFTPSLLGYHLPKWIFKGTVFLIRNLPRFLSFMKDFLWQLFVRIHSELRVLCAVDSAIGACIGYMTGSALIGAVAGALFGLLNYEIITKRFLRIHIPIDRDRR